MNDIRKPITFSPPWIVAHRGFKKKYPENTLAAFQAAMDAGVTMVELDVTLTRDRKLVVIHDATLERTTNGYGPVNDYTLEELKHLDAGSWFESGFADQRLPDLAEVLELVDGRVYINIEIKPHAYEPRHPPNAIEKQVVELLRQKNLLNTGMISSFDVNILEQTALMKAAPAIAFISTKTADRNTVQMCSRLNVFSWHPYHKIVTRQQVDMMHDAGIKVFPYNVDTIGDYSRMRDLKVDGVITGDPSLSFERTRLKKAA